MSEAEILNSAASNIIGSDGKMRVGSNALAEYETPRTVRYDPVVLTARAHGRALAESCTCFRGGSNRSNLNVAICSLLITTKIFLIVAAVISRDFVMTFIVAVVVVELLPT